MTERQMKTLLIRSGKRKALMPKCKFYVDDVFNPNDEKKWYDIPGFDRYQVDLDHGYIRSLSDSYLSHFGVIKPYKHTANGIVYTLRDNRGINRSITYDQIADIAEGNPNLSYNKTFQLPKRYRPREIIHPIYFDTGEIEFGNKYEEDTGLYFDYED